MMRGGKINLTSPVFNEGKRLDTLQTIPTVTHILWSPVDDFNPQVKMSNALDLDRYCERNTLISMKCRMMLEDHQYPQQIIWKPMSLNDFEDLLTFPQVPPSGQIINFEIYYLKIYRTDWAVKQQRRHWRNVSIVFDILNLLPWIVKTVVYLRLPFILDDSAWHDWVAYWSIQRIPRYASCFCQRSTLASLTTVTMF